MKTKLFYLTFFLFSSYALLAQQGIPAKASSVTEASYMREIPAISQMRNIIAAEGMQHLQAPEKKRGVNTFIPGKGFPRNGDPLVNLQQRHASRAAITNEIASFDAHRGTVLNDPTGAIGPNHYVYAFNAGFGILDRAGNVLVPEASLGTLFPGETLGDPIVVYDNFADRFIVMEFSNSPNGILIAVCQGPDPVNDGWFTYRFNTGTFPDYEKLSIWTDGYYITANKDQNAPDANDVVFAVERDRMLVGDSGAQMIGFPLPGAETNGFYSPGGFNATGESLPPLGTGTSIVYLQDDGWGGVSQDHLKIWTTNVDWTNPTNSTISQPQEISTTPFDSVFDAGSFSNLPQPNGGDIDALQATMMYMTHYRRFATHNSAVMNFAVDLNGNDNLAGIRWYELRQTGDGQPWSIYQEGTYAQPDGLSAFCGGIGMDAQGNIGLGYSVVSNNVFVSLRYTGRLASDPLGTMTAVEQVSANGDSTVPGTRYGDYGQLTIDPLDDRTFWHIGEYMRDASTGVRKSHVVAFNIQQDTPDTEAPSVPSNVVASDISENQLSLTWDASTDNIGVVSYDVLQNGEVVGNVTGTTITISELTASTTYSFTIVAKDAAGNESEESEAIDVTTAAPDTEAPSIPTNIVAQSIRVTSVVLTWDASTDNVGVANYQVFQDGELAVEVSEPSATISGLTRNTIYAFTVVAIDIAGNVSDASEAINVTTIDLGPGCTEGVELPYSESFEADFAGWTQDSSDDLDWSRNTNGTPSRNTGPSSADDGSTYIYVEASGNGTGFPNKRAVLTSPCIDLNGISQATFSFRYHMFGASNFGTLTAEASNDEGETWTSIWSRSGNQGNSWQTAEIDLAAYLDSGLQLRFVRVTGNTWRADAAIDAISIIQSTDPGPGGSDCAPGSLNLSITFDDYPQETSWTITDSQGVTVASNSYSTANPDGSTVTEAINNLTTGEYTFTISDSFGDGICCAFGNGSYTLTGGDIEIVSGGEFGASEVTNFCVEAVAAKVDTYALSLDESQYVISPNPTRGILNISEGKSEIQSLEIFSMYGQLVRSIEQGNKYQINVSEFPAGTYFVRITVEEAIFTKSFIKK